MSSLASKTTGVDQKKVLITSRVHPEIKNAALVAADVECRSIGSLIEKLLKDYLKQRGYVS